MGHSFRTLGCPEGVPHPGASTSYWFPVLFPHFCYEKDRTEATTTTTTTTTTVAAAAAAAQ